MHVAHRVFLDCKVPGPWHVAGRGAFEAAHEDVLRVAKKEHQAIALI